jgi:hypothetical protein
VREKDRQKGMYALSKKERRLEEAEEDQRQVLPREGDFIEANVRT